MSLAVITDSSVNLPAEIQGHADVYVLDIPVIIEGQPFVEGKNLDVNQFYAQMANFEELLKTSQPNLADLDNLLTELEEKGYTHVIGLFLSIFGRFFPEPYTTCKFRYVKFYLWWNRSSMRFEKDGDYCGSSAHEAVYTRMGRGFFFHLRFLQFPVFPFPTSRS